MTTEQPRPEQEPEYIITESQLKRLTKSIIYGGNNYLNSDYCLLPIQEARSRPYTAPLTQDTTGKILERINYWEDEGMNEDSPGKIEYYKKLLIEHDKKIQQDEREKVIDNIMNEATASRYQEAIHADAPPDFVPQIVVTVWRLRDIVETLRKKDGG